MVKAIDRKNKISGKTKNPQDFTRAKARHTLRLTAINVQVTCFTFYWQQQSHEHVRTQPNYLHRASKRQNRCKWSITVGASPRPVPVHVQVMETEFARKGPSMQPTNTTKFTYM